MTNEVQIFEDTELGKLRMIEEDGKILFVASDVAKALGYSNISDAISRHCRYIVKHDIPHPQGKGTLEVNVILEGDVYRLITHSKLPSAEKFESWVFDEVLPSIRKTGSYIMRSEPTQFEIDELEFKKQDLIARKAELWMKLGESVQIDNYKQICNSYAARELAGNNEFILPLPAVEKKSYSATEIGKILGISANKVGKLANQHGLKIDKYGKWFYDKSPYSKKEVESFRYFDSVIDVLKSYI